VLASILITGFLAVLSTWLVRRHIYEARLGSARERATEILRSAQAEADRSARLAREEALLVVRRQALTQQEEAEATIESQRRALHREWERLEAREVDLRTRIDVLERKASHVNRRADELIARAKELDEREVRIDALKEERIRRLEAVSGMGREEASTELRASIVKGARADAMREANRLIQAAQTDAGREARRVLAAAIQRNAVAVVNESTVSTIELASDDMKGRIIGREGRNIRSFESETGVDVIIDDTPCRVFLSSFNPEIREVARLALEELLADGRIHPARIEDVVASARAQFGVRMREIGEMAAFEAEVYGLAEELILHLGRLSFCVMGGQNALQHSIEVSHLAAAMAQMIGADEILARRAGLLHDLGWSRPGDVTGDPHQATLDLLAHYGESDRVQETVAGMRQGRSRPPVEAVLVAAANEVSKARPGARRDQLRRHVRRLETMEDVARGIRGVERVHAVQAGRELHVIVDPGVVDDSRVFELSQEVARKIQKELRYSGSIRVTVIRQFRSTAIAQ
jgi:ribonuclease Y